MGSSFFMTYMPQLQHLRRALLAASSLVSGTQKHVLALVAPVQHRDAGMGGLEDYEMCSHTIRTAPALRVPGAVLSVVGQARPDHGHISVPTQPSLTHAEHFLQPRS